MKLTYTIFQIFLFICLNYYNIVISNALFRWILGKIFDGYFFKK